MDATRVETATLAAKIRKLAMYAQQLAETGIKAEGRSGGRFQSGDGHMAAKTGSWLCTPSSWLKQVLKLKAGQVGRFQSGDGHGGQDQEAGNVRPPAG